jgi:hypothetical protein
MLTKLFAGAALVGAIGLTAAPALADPSVCYNVHAQVQDQVVDQVGCLP